MKSVRIQEGVYQFGKQIGTADLPNFLKEMNNRKAPHYPRSKWQRKMERHTATNPGGGFVSKAFQPATKPVTIRPRHLSAKQQAKAQADHAAIMAMRKH